MHSARWAKPRQEALPPRGDGPAERTAAQHPALGVALVGECPRFEEPVTTALESVRRITDTAVLNTLPLRIEVVTIDRAMPLAEFDERHASAIAIDELAILNQVEVDEILSAGTRVKRVVRG